MSGVDNRVVAMQFDNAEFERKLTATLGSLDRLSSTIKLAGAQQGLTEVASAANKFDMSHMASAVENISSKFSAMGAVGFAAIDRVTNSVMSFVSNMANTAKTDILGPMISGGTDRAKNIEQAKFQFRGLGMDVDKSMASALGAVQGTAYGLDEAAKIAAQFGASGMKAGDQMTGALRGIAGAAAMTGSSFSEIGDIFAQSAASGRVGTQDLQQFATRGLNAAAAVAKATGKTEAQVRDMASHGTLDFTTFAAAMDKSFGKHATEANQTYAGSLANLHAAMSRLGASFEGPKMEQERDLFNALSPAVDKLSKAMQPLIKAFIDGTKVGNDHFIAFLKKLDFTKYSGTITVFATVIKDAFIGIQNGVAALKDVFDAAREGIGEIFPPSTHKNLVTLMETFDKFTKALIPSRSTLISIHQIFTGLAAAFDIVIGVAKGLIGIVVEIVKQFSGAGTGALSFTARMLDWIRVADAWLISGGHLAAFFTMIRKYIDEAGAAVRTAVSWLGAFFTVVEADAGKVGSAIKDIVGWFQALFGKLPGQAEPTNKTLHDFGETVGTATTHVQLLEALFGRLGQRFHEVANIFAAGSASFTVLQHILGGIEDVLGKAGAAIHKWFSELGANIAASIKPGDFNAGVDAVNVGLVGGILLMLKKFNATLKGLDVTGGMFKSIKATLSGVRDQLKAMQAEVKAKAIEEIAIALAVLTASILVLSLIDSAKLTKAMTALAIGMGELVATMKLMDSIASGSKEASKFGILAGAMTLLAGAVLILSGAVVIMAHLSWEQLAKGLGAVTALLTLMVVTAQTMEGNAAGMVAAGLSMIPLATGLVIMAGAVELFGHMSWETMAKGMLGLAVALGIIAGIMTAMPVVSLIAAGIAMIPLATGITILAGAIKIFATMSWGEMAKGMVALAGALAIIAITMTLMPVTLPITAAGLVLVGVALTIMAGAMKSFGSMDWGAIAKALVAIAGLMIILAVGVTAMSGALGGAAAMVVVSGALMVLTKVLVELSHLSWGDLAKGLAGIAGVFLVVGVAGLALTPVIPALMGLGVAMTLIGGGFALFGVGAMLMGKALEVLAKSGKAAAEALIATFKLVLEAIPEYVATLVFSLGKSIGDISQATGLMLKLVTVLLLQILETIIKIAPKIAEALVAIIISGLSLIRKVFPDVATTALDMLVVLLTTIEDNMDRITQLALDILLDFIDTLKANTNTLTDAAVNLMLAFIGAIAGKADDIAAAGLNLLLSFIAAMVNNDYRIIDFAVSVMITFAQTIGNEVGRIVDAGANILVKFVEGVGRDIQKVIDKGVEVVIKLLDAMSSDAVGFTDKAAKVLIAFLNGMADAINTNAPQIRAAGANLAQAIVDGITGGLLDPKNIGSIIDAAKGLVQKGYQGAKDWLLSKSPSKRFMLLGQSMAQGVALALDQDTTAQNSAVAHAERIVNAFQETLSKIPDALVGLDEFAPTITPVLDLSKVHAGAKGIADLVAGSSIAPVVSFDQARYISTTADLTGQPAQDPLAAQQPKQVTFNQTINAPTALSTNDIYKNTNSQIARAKEELNI